MGNCSNRCRRSKSAVADADEDYQSHVENRKTEQEDVSMSEGTTEGVSSSATEVKIKMTKKEMKEMLAKVEEQGMQVGEVLAELLEKRVERGDGSGEESEMRRQQSWRPMLQSIPEIYQLK